MHQRQKSKNRIYKLRLKDYENQSQIIMKDQRDFEQSIKDITKKHDVNTNLIDQELYKIENQVSQLKFTKDNLNSYYESQLDQAHKEMLNFYNNLDNCDEEELSNSGQLFQDRNFFIKPTQVISQHLQNTKSNITNSAMYSQIIDKSDKQASKSNFRLKITSNKVVKTERQMQTDS